MIRNMFRNKILFITLFCNVEVIVCNPHAKRLYEDVLTGYRKFIKPASGADDAEPLEIKFRVKLAQIIDVEWVDSRLKWNPSRYGRIRLIHVSPQLIWLPDIVLYNSADGNFKGSLNTKVTVEYTGRVVWAPPAIFKSMCPIDVEWFPFDRQICFLKFGSWMYDKKELDLVHGHNESLVKKVLEIDLAGAKQTVWLVDQGIDISDYNPSVEWDLMAAPGRRHENHYPCCPEESGFVDITYHLVMRRKTGFYIINFIAPCLSLSILTVPTFYLPSESREKISLCISILISQTVFLLLLVEIIPSTSIVLPLIGRFLLFTMLLVSLSIAVTVFVINTHFAGPHGAAMPEWVKVAFLEILPHVVGLGTLSQRKSKKKKRDEVLVNLNLNDRVDKVKNILKKKEGSFLKKSEKKNMTRVTIGSLYLDRLTSLNNNSLTPYVIKRASCSSMANELTYLANSFKGKNQVAKDENAWKHVAMVLDRVFLILFCAAIAFGTLSILLQAPALYDNNKPIT